MLVALFLYECKDYYQQKKGSFTRYPGFSVLLDSKEVAGMVDKKILVVDEGVYTVQLTTRWKWVKKYS